MKHKFCSDKGSLRKMILFLISIYLYEHTIMSDYESLSLLNISLSESSSTSTKCVVPISVLTNISKIYELNCSLTESNKEKDSEIERLKKLLAEKETLLELTKHSQNITKHVGCIFSALPITGRRPRKNCCGKF
jgi:hypothetical protein